MSKKSSRKTKSEDIAEIIDAKFKKEIEAKTKKHIEKQLGVDVPANVAKALFDMALKRAGGLEQICYDAVEENEESSEEESSEEESDDIGDSVSAQEESDGASEEGPPRKKTRVDDLL